MGILLRIFSLLISSIPSPPFFFPQLMLKQSHWTQINRSLLIPFEKKMKKRSVCMCVVQEDQNEAKVKGKRNVKRETESLPWYDLQML